MDLVLKTRARTTEVKRALPLSSELPVLELKGPCVPRADVPDGPAAAARGPEARDDNRLRLHDRAAHQWYRFVLSFPPHLVRDYVAKFGLDSGRRVLDPFCGTGTTVVECKKLGIPAAGLEPNPMACFASRTKVNWKVDPDKLLEHAQTVARLAAQRLENGGLSEDAGLPLFQRGPVQVTALRKLPPAAADLLLAGSISPWPLDSRMDQGPSRQR